MRRAQERRLSEQSDEDLVRKYQEAGGSEDALLELYERHRTVTYAFFCRRIGIPEIAAEENQELYLSVVKHLNSFRGESSFRTWLFQIAHNRLSHLRRRWRVHVDERADDIPEHMWEQLASQGDTNPERLAGKSESGRVLRRCLAALPEIERAVVFGQYYAGVTLQFLTDELNLVNKSGARAKLIAAQRRLRSCLEKAGLRSSGLSDRPEGGS